MDEISSATVDERPVAMRKPVSSDQKWAAGALQVFLSKRGIIVHRNTSIYIMSNVVDAMIRNKYTNTRPHLYC